MQCPHTVLIVEDDAPGRAMLSLSLRQAGYSVTTASGGEEALRMLKKASADWLITDAKMQPMDGFELSGRAKELDPKLRIIMISAIYGERDINGHPIEKFFSKPVAVDQLLAWLSRPLPR